MEQKLYKMKLPTSTIKEFEKKTSRITTNGIMPILSYISLEVKSGILTLSKSNLSSYCKYSAPFEHEDLQVLLEERIIIGFANVTKSETIDVSIEGKEVTLSDGNLTQTFETGNFDEYPSFPDNTVIKTPITFNEQQIRSIVVASKYTDVKAAQYGYVHILPDCIWGSNGYSIYYKTYEGLTNIILSPESAQVIGQYSELTHYSIDNYDFFDSGSTVYGFVKPEFKTPDLTALIGKYIPLQGFKIDKEQLEIFCTTSINLCNLLTYSTITDNGNTLLLELNNNGNKKTNKLTIVVEKTEQFEPFKFDSSNMLSALKSIPYEYLTMTMTDNKIILHNEEDKDYFGIIMGVNHK